jgi:hypothetical protein|tara:strand:- start:352 stop:606 length:255 start_codon:yes stop_codon:yes gene_type:complete
MAIKEEEQKKNGMKIVDNMDGMKNATEKLNMKVADVSDKMNTKEIQEYLRRAKSGEDVTRYLDKFDLKKIELDQLAALAAKRDS